MSQNRLQEIDILKSIGIFFIILCHMDNYLFHYEIIRYFDDYFAFLGLNLFIFISGFALKYNNAINSRKDFFTFYKKRLLRVFPLYWISLLSLVVIFKLLKVNSGLVSPYDISINNLIVHFLGLQIIFPFYYIQSMWYIGLIVLYYTIYPFLVYLSKNTVQLIFFSSLFISPFILLHLNYNVVDSRVFTYYLVFISGIVFCDYFHLTTYIKTINVILFFSSIFLITGTLILLYLFNIIPNIYIIFTILRIIFQLLFGIVSFYFITCIKDIIGFKYIGLSSKIAYASYSVYLFHHQLLAMFKLVTSVFFSNTILSDFFILLVGVPCTFFIGYFIQKFFSISSKYFASLFSKIHSLYLFES